MPEEIKTDQAQVQPEAKPEQSDKPVLPEKDFFQGDSMFKFMEQIEAAAEKPAAKPKPEEKAKEEPCVGCDDDKTKATAEAKPQPEERKPIKVLKVKGKDVPVYSEDELTELAQKGADYTQKRQRDADWERDLEAREAKIERVAPLIERLLQQVESGQPIAPGTQKESKPEEEEEQPIDPAAERLIKKMQARLDQIESENKTLKQSSQQEFFKRAQEELNNTFVEVTKEHPFTQVKDEEGRNISQELFSAVAAFKANRDQIQMKTNPGHKMRSIQEYFAETARDIAYLEKHFKSNGQPTEITPETVKTQFPKVAEKLGEEAIETYLRQKEDGSAPVVKPSKAEPSVTASKKDIKGLDDGLAQAMNDPRIMDAFAEIGETHKRTHGG